MNPEQADVTTGLQVFGIHAAPAANAGAAIISAIPAKVSAFDHVRHGFAGRVEQAGVLSDRAWMQIDHHRSRRQEAGERKAGVYAPPVEGQPVAGVIRRGPSNVMNWRRLARNSIRKLFGIKGQHP